MVGELRTSSDNVRGIEYDGVYLVATDSANCPETYGTLVVITNYYTTQTFVTPNGTWTRQYIPESGGYWTIWRRYASMGNNRSDITWIREYYSPSVTTDNWQKIGTYSIPSGTSQGYNTVVFNVTATAGWNSGRPLGLAIGKDCNNWYECNSRVVNHDIHGGLSYGISTCYAGNYNASAMDLNIFEYLGQTGLASVDLVGWYYYCNT